MPLHDWSDDRGWDSLHVLWLNQLLDWVQPRLPAGFRAYLGSVPALTIDIPQSGRADLHVRQWPAQNIGPSVEGGVIAAPDQETAATFVLDPQLALHVDFHGKLVSALELTSPRNKDRPAARERYLGRYEAYLLQGVHLLLIDALPRPGGFSFADMLAADLGISLPETLPPFAISFRVGEPLPQGTLLALWRRPLTIGQPLPVIPLALDVHQAVPIDLDSTYQQAARRAYLE